MIPCDHCHKREATCSYNQKILGIKQMLCETCLGRRAPDLLDKINNLKETLKNTNDSKPLIPKTGLCPVVMLHYCPRCNWYPIRVWKQNMICLYCKSTLMVGERPLVGIPADSYTIIQKYN